MDLLGTGRNIGLTPDSRMSRLSQSQNDRVIKEVWCYNLDNEMSAIMSAATRYPYIGMDTEFPGICFYSKDNQSNFFDYSIIRENVDCLKLIQLGITFCTEDGTVAKDCPIWQFNFRFDPAVDLCNAESIQLLENAGINFKAHASKGIEARRFGELITMSGLVLSPSITWITFHGVYDVAYLLRILIGCDLPSSMSEFVSLMRIFFPHMYDVKAMIVDCKDLNGSLNRVAQQTQVARVGKAHQSGSDSQMTAEVFFRICERYFPEGVHERFDGLLYNVQA